MSAKKRGIQIGIFLLIMTLTFFALFRGQNLSEISRAVRQMSPEYIFFSVLLALCFVCAEGGMIWYLLRSMPANKNKRGTSFFRCIQYSFIGFFYSGITPSATGGQPVQLYYMNKDGNRGSESTVVLMTVAVVYKFVLVIMGTGILIFWFTPLRSVLGKYFYLYIFGLFLNIVLVMIISCVMLFPGVILKVALTVEKLLIKMKVWKPSQYREEGIRKFVKGYQDAVVWLRNHKSKLAVVIVMTFFQRCSVFVLTYVVYLGFGLEGIGGMKVIILQASVYIAVDMLPLPGAQGITELMYKTVFVNVFTGAYLIPSMLVSRGINFYFLLIVSLLVVLANRFVLNKKGMENCC